MTSRRRRFRRVDPPERVVATEAVIAVIRETAERALPRETGGILLGHRAATELVVAEVLEVPDSEATSNRYTRDRQQGQALLDARLATEAEGSLLGYVGDWHSHTRAADASDQDLGTLGANSIADGDCLAVIITIRVAEGWQEIAFASGMPSGRRTSVTKVPLSTELQPG